MWNYPHIPSVIIHIYTYVWLQQCLFPPGGAGCGPVRASGVSVCGSTGVPRMNLNLAEGFGGLLTSPLGTSSGVIGATRADEFRIPRFPSCRSRRSFLPAAEFDARLKSAASTAEAVKADETPVGAAQRE